MPDDEVLTEQLDALCDELAEALAEAPYSERWAIVCDRLPALSDPARARAVQTRRFNGALADRIGGHLAQGEYGILYKLGMRGIWIGDRRYWWPEFEAIPVEPARAVIRDAPSPLDGTLIEPASRLVRAILRVLVADPTGLAFYELVVRWSTVLADWSRPENAELVPVDEARLNEASSGGPYVVVQPHAVLGLGPSAVEAAHDAYANDAFLFELGARLCHYAGGPMATADDDLYLAPCSLALARQVLAHGGAGVDWCWRAGRLRLADEVLH